MLKMIERNAKDLATIVIYLNGSLALAVIFEIFDLVVHQRHTHGGLRPFFFGVPFALFLIAILLGQKIISALSLGCCWLYSPFFHLRFGWWVWHLFDLLAFLLCLICSLYIYAVAERLEQTNRVPFQEIASN